MSIDLSAPLPMAVEWQGVEYPLCPWFDNVLAMLEAVKDCTARESQSLALFFLLAAEDFPDDPGLYAAVSAVMFPPKKHADESARRALDFLQDAPYIYAAFRQAYGIDLYAEQGRLHWLSFVALLSAIPADTKLAEIIEIRLRPLPKPTKHNRDQIQNLMHLKTLYALDVLPEERKASLQKGLMRLAENLLNFAGERSENNGR